MGITALPSDPNKLAAESKLKLLAAARPSVAKPDSSPPVKKLTPANPVALSNEAQLLISKLKARDTQVHQHEQAHLSASAGIDVSNASFTYQKGPNGVNYAVDGEVKIDTSPGRTPEETLARAEMIRDAALAPVDPSATDRSVAAKAQDMAMQARVEIMQQGHGHTDGKHAEHRPDAVHAYDIDKPAHKHIDTFV